MEATSWNTGPWVEIADVEAAAATRALKQALQALQALEAPVARDPPAYDPPDIHIFVDSQAAIQRLQGRGDATVQQAKALAQYMTERYGARIYLTWCPGHEGINGNEIADQQAKLGLKKPISPKAYISISRLRGLARQKAIERWKALLQQPGQAGLGKHYGRVTRDLGTYTTRPHRALKAYTKQSLSAYIQLKTGIGSLKTHLYTIRKANSNYCNRCDSGKEQTTSHLLLFCSRYNDERKLLQKALRGLPLTLQTLLCTGLGRLALAAYINSTGVCTIQWSQNRPEEA
jgi:ribonuclease HI